MNFLKDIQSLPERIHLEDDDTDCPDCDGYGYIVTDNDVGICHCLAERNVNHRLERANIPKRYKNKTLDSFKPDIDSRRRSHGQVFRFAEDFAHQQERSGLFLYGPSGTGKTHLAIGALKELLATGLTGLFYNIVTLVGDLRLQAGGAAPQETLERIERSSQVDILVLDDLGASRISDFVQEQIYSIVDKRYSENRCLIVTSNLPLNELEKQITYPVFSRIKDMCLTVETGEIDFRVPDLQLNIGKKRDR